MGSQIRDGKSTTDGSVARLGVAYGVAAYVWWGLVPIYFKAVATVSAPEVLAHRIICSVVLLAVLLRVHGRWRVAVAALRDRRTVITLLGTDRPQLVRLYLGRRERPGPSGETGILYQPAGQRSSRLRLFARAAPAVADLQCHARRGRCCILGLFGRRDSARRTRSGRLVRCLRAAPQDR